MAESVVLRWIAAGVVALLVLVGVGVWALFRIMAPMTDAATHFVVTAGTAGPVAAYAEASPALRAETSELRFEAKLKALRLTQAKSAHWWTRKQRGDVGVVAGTVTLASGDAEPVTIHLVKSGGRWMVSDLHYGTSLSFTGD